MKKILLIGVIALVFNSATNAQTESPNTEKWQQITIGFGSSVPGLLTNVFSTSSYVNTSFATPVFNITYSYLLQDNISVGAVIGYQNVFLDLLPLSGQTSGISFNLNRFNASLHTEYYIVQKNKFDLYLGGKVGISAWWGEVSFTELIDYLNEIIPNDAIANAITKDMIPSNENFKSINFSYQFTAGLDYFFTNNIGLKAELAFGAPYWANLGINYRF